MDLPLFGPFLLRLYQFVGIGWFFAVLDLEVFFNFSFEVLYVDGLFLRRLLAHFKGFGIKILIDSVSKTGWLIQNGLGLLGGVNSPRDNPHLILIQPQILNAIRIAHNRLHFIIYLV